MNTNIGYVTRQVNYFFGKQGHEFALVFAESTVIVTDRTQLRMVDRPDFVGLVSKAPATRWGGLVPRVEGDGASYITDHPSIEAAADAVRAEASALRAEADRAATDPVYALERALKNHDWTSWASDDHRVWSAGERAAKQIEELRAKVAPEVYDALVAKYNPNHEGK